MSAVGIHEVVGTKHDGAQPLCLRALTILERQFGSNHRNVIMVRNSVSEQLQATIKPGEANMMACTTEVLPEGTKNSPDLVSGSMLGPFTHRAHRT
jgi:hypothetical protein